MRSRTVVSARTRASRIGADRVTGIVGETTSANVVRQLGGSVVSYTSSLQWCTAIDTVQGEFQVGPKDTDVVLQLNHLTTGSSEVYGLQEDAITVSSHAEYAVQWHLETDKSLHYIQTALQLRRSTSLQWEVVSRARRCVLILDAGDTVRVVLNTRFSVPVLVQRANTSLTMNNMGGERGPSGPGGARGGDGVG